MFNVLPTRFRHYEVLKLLGGGGFGVVYLAHDSKLRRDVVLKMLHPHLAAQPDMVRRFVQEARAMARLDHVNIVRVNRVEDHPQRPFFEMEYVAGQTLKEYRGTKTLSLSEALPILRQMAAALDAAHQQKIIHRDVKPANVLIKPDGQLKLTDFGIIKLLDSTGTVHPSTMGIIGTPSYMAPEQADLSRKQEIGPGCDIYALGVMTFELLTSRLPFEGSSYHTILGAHVTQPPANPRTFNPNLTEPIAQVLLQVLAKQPANRYPSAMAFVDALQDAASSGTVPPPPSITDTFTAASGGHVSTSPVTPSLSSQSPPATPTSAPSIPKSMMVGFVVVVLVAMIVGGLLREVFSTSPEPEPEIVQATLTQPIEIATEPTEVPILPATASVQPTATPGPPTELGLGSTIVAQDGMTQLYVPAGEFLRGSNEDDLDASDNEKPPRSIYLDAFWIDKTEVTNEMFARFVDETAHQTEAEKTGWGYTFTDEKWVVTDGAEWRHPQGPTSSVEGLAQHPVVQVSWNDALAYCEWAERRLPTEAEWEKAARGVPTEEGSQIYPWGNEEITGRFLNFCDQNCSYSNGRIDSIDDGYEFTAPVGTYPDGASPYGALDMAGNVWEWTADWYNEAYYKDAPEQNPLGPDTGETKVVRGGSWYDGTQKLRVAVRDSYDPVNRTDDYGFRCAVSP